MKLRHNKKRNTAFLFEVLVRELTIASLKANKPHKKTVIKILKEFFNKSTILNAELDLYKSVTSSSNLNNKFAEKVLSEAKSRHQKLNKKTIFDSQTKLIKEINEKLGKGVFENFILDYKNLATAYQVLYENTDVKEQIKLEEQILERLQTSPDAVKEEKYKPVSKLTFKTFYNKFNETYGSELLKEQKELIQYYVSSYETDDLEFKVFLNEEIGRLKSNLINATKDKTNPLVIEKRDQIINVLNSFSKKEIDKTVLEKVLKLQQLTEEMTNSGN
tara:strand:+ start:362 stop:1186 length:825 start_codon:yes stop_codon:yes gene_type:complete